MTFDPTRNYWEKIRTDNERLGACLTLLRKQAMMTQPELVTHLDRLGATFDVPTFSRVEAGSMIPTGRNAVALSNWMVEQSPEDVLQALGSPVARSSDPQTSHDAGRSVTAATMKALHLWWLRHLERYSYCNPDQMNILGVTNGYYMTDEGARTQYQGPKVSESGFRTRRAELKHAELVRDSGCRYPISTGRLAIAWELTPEGRITLKENS